MVVGPTIAFSSLVLIGRRNVAEADTARTFAHSRGVSGLPVWAAMPLAVTGIALVGALFGYMWTSPAHRPRRDAGPSPTLALFILVGLYGSSRGYLSPSWSNPASIRSLGDPDRSGI